MGVEKEKLAQLQDKKSKKGRGKKKSGGDYDGWILRLIDNVEDIQHMFNLQEWLDFAASKIIEPQGYDLTTAQIEVLGEKQDMVFEVIPDKLSLNFEYITRFRGPGGRFVKSEIPGAIPEVKTRYRNIEKAYGQRTGTMVSTEKINIEISRLKGARRWDKL